MTKVKANDLRLNIPKYIRQNEEDAKQLMNDAQLAMWALDKNIWDHQLKCPHDRLIQKRGSLMGHYTAAKRMCLDCGLIERRHELGVYFVLKHQDAILATMDQEEFSRYQYPGTPHIARLCRVCRKVFPYDSVNYENKCEKCREKE